ncbi:YbhB/YbcL family Raf kinase inhibitor-like protein [Pediococcus claussenii]|uniref:Phosphatidylethanolamine-binding family protein n=1 Tax=Pediococcus claussenii (strain ATCC BAA-344 / DSM 14800 / JCM 18046 / KCTC 3811 / LMG 21948 / P06) TaxID=701521 RepID=G8PBW8_PEDCP|nr:YbhB/YbcL family Raf kinase inhibitor-like protein [Pediococcus claussenii]AEV96026.1 phosphatidylethanolamine-binding family protein [Pediococcus claussenii ATCC BAA-344]ANZ69511.1 hypothetical protein AYR57_03935 [Pediococcus claussenii]ANZ71330.1 hypothetical protein AYR58_03950 [Pediococcus claussenii]KRN19448.1 hypothetical protein IV79_GL001501 [Pediococcus claussenii]
MNVTTTFNNNIIPDQFGMNTDTQNLTNGINQHSFPFNISNLGSETHYLAWTLIDYDTIPLIGFAWIHWQLANYPVTYDEVQIEADLSLKVDYPQGKNSLISIIQRIRKPLWKLKSTHENLESHYQGPRPRSGIHHYRLTVYGLRHPLVIQKGFYQSDLMNQLDTSVVTESVSKNLLYERK